MTRRVPYWKLSVEQLEDVRAWLIEHGIKPWDVSTDAAFCYDPAPGEWLIETVARDEHGRIEYDGLGEPRTLTVRVKQQRPLPWPTEEVSDGPRTT